MIQKKCRIPIEIQVLSFKKHSIDDVQTVFDVMRGVIQTPQFKSRNSFHFQAAKSLSIRQNNQSFTLGVSDHNPKPTLQLTVTVIKKIGGSKFKIGIDLTFNAIKQVRKIPFKHEAPLYRDVDDGLCWCCYCMDYHCKIYKELFIIKKGYGKFNLHKQYDMRQIRCPVCRTTKVQVRNCGFVKCEWQIKSCYREGNLQSFSGKTYDSSLHTLKQSNLLDAWKFFQIQVNKLPRHQLISGHPRAPPRQHSTQIYEIDEFNIYNLPSINDGKIQEAQTNARKQFQMTMMPPKIHSNSPSPEPDDFYQQLKYQQQQSGQMQSNLRGIGGFGLASNNIFIERQNRKFGRGISSSSAKKKRLEKEKSEFINAMDGQALVSHQQGRNSQMRKSFYGDVQKDQKKLDSNIEDKCNIF